MRVLVFINPGGGGRFNPLLLGLPAELIELPSIGGLHPVTIVALFSAEMRSQGSLWFQEDRRFIRQRPRSLIRIQSFSMKKTNSSVRFPDGCVRVLNRCSK
jgi:hypothetical protein